LIAIVSSTWEEIKGIVAILSKSEDGEWEGVRYISGKISDKPVLLVITGVGIKRARKATSFIIQKFKSDLVISAGFGGALSPGLKVGDIVIGEWVLSLKRNEKRILLSDLPHVEHDFIKGGIITENRFIYDPIEKKKLFEKSGALTVDMETWGVAEAAIRGGVKVLSVRSISDEFSETLPDMGFIFDAKSVVLDKRKAFTYFLSHPSHIISYIRYTKFNTKKSSNSLSSFLRKIIFVV
jgi:adenosylhomocysteine nucleosidase